MLTTELEFEVVVKSKQSIANNIAQFELQNPDGSPLPAWQPGSHIDVIISDEITRQYSLCGEPKDTDSWKIAVLREESGRGGSLHLHDNIKAGSTLRVRGPRNHFELRNSPQYLFIAGGIGITPLMSMIQSAELSGAEWNLIYVGRSRSSMAFADELLATYPHRVDIFARDEQDRPDLDEILRIPSSEKKVFSCGPNSLQSAIESAMADWPEGSHHFEHFSPKELGGLLPNTAFSVELTKSEITVEVSADETILDAVRKSGLRVLSSCGEGTCGTCETAVLEGAVDHRDSLLSPEEQASNETMMICVSRALSPRLKLEL